MSKTFSLQPLQKLAQQKTEDATQRLGKLSQQQQSAQSQLEALQQYRRDYQTRLQQAMQEGIGQTELSNFHDFIRRLDQAITQQQAVMDQAQRSVQLGRGILTEAQRKMKTFDALEQRYLENQQRLVVKAEQKAQDEFASRQAARHLVNETA